MADLAARAPRVWLSAHGAVATDPIVIPDDYRPRVPMAVGSTVELEMNEREWAPTLYGGDGAFVVPDGGRALIPVHVPVSVFVNDDRAAAHRALMHLALNPRLNHRCMEYDLCRGLPSFAKTTWEWPPNRFSTQVKSQRIRLLSIPYHLAVIVPSASQY